MSPSKPGDPQKGKPADDRAHAAGGRGSETEAAAAEAKETAGTEEAAAQGTAAEPKRKPRRRKATPKAEATAAAETGVGKDAAEAALQEGSGEPAAEEPVAAEEPPADEPADDDEAAAPAAPAPRARPGRRRRRAGGRASDRVTVRAHAKYVRTSARKARLVCDHIRGKSVEEARAILAHTPRAVARDWSKLLESAVANAEHNHELVGDELRIDSVTADEGPTLKRFRPRAYGRATRIRKRTSHLTITLTPKE
jgi:ribosomal protein L22